MGSATDWQCIAAVQAMYCCHTGSVLRLFRQNIIADIDADIVTDILADIDANIDADIVDDLEADIDADIDY
jgi:hypothetical protein